MNSRKKLMTWYKYDRSIVGRHYPSSIRSRFRITHEKPSMPRSVRIILLSI